MTEGQIRRANIRSALDDLKKQTNGDRLRDDALRDLLHFLNIGWSSDFRIVTGTKMNGDEIRAYLLSLRT